MANKKGEYSADVVITSAKHAEEMSAGLPSIWSHESLLSQRTLIYVAKLLEEQNALLALVAHRTPQVKSGPTKTNWLKRLFGRK
jgi:hypothetical protein